MPKKLHATTTAYLAEARKPKVFTTGKAEGVIEKADAGFSKIAQQHMVHLAALNAAMVRETDEEVRGRFEEARQTHMAVIRLVQEIDKRTSDLLIAIRQSDDVNARITEAAGGDADDAG